MAKSPPGKATKAPARKLKPAPKRRSRTIMAETMTPQPETPIVMDIGGRKVAAVTFNDLRFDDAEPVNSEAVDTNLKPITIEGTFDRGILAFSDPVPREITMVVGRRFLWWTVANQRVRHKVRLDPDTITKTAGGVSVSMQCEGPAVVIRSPWWERTLYAIARIWS